MVDDAIFFFEGAYAGQMGHHKLYRKVKETLHALYGERLKGLVLYGPEAMGETDAIRSVDFMVLLEGPVEQWQERKKLIRAFKELLHGVPDRRLVFIPVDIEAYNSKEHVLRRSL